MSKVRFGDIVKDVKNNVDRGNNPFEFYVAGDHMDSEDLTIRRKGRFSTDDVGPAFVRIFKPGQVLYGSRRTYLKKVAVADFEGICANTTFVLETKNPALFEQKLLPFLMLSDGFTNWSISQSKGSTNPYVLFSDLAAYEVNLPSLTEQKVLAEKLWAAYEVKQSYLKMIEATQEMVKSQFIEMFGDISINSKAWPVEKLANVANIKIGPFGSLIHQRDYQEGGHCLINPSQIINNKIVPDSKVAVTEYKYQELLSYTVSIGDIILGRRGEMGRAGIIEEEGMLCGTGSMVIKPKDKGDSLFLHLFITSPHSKEWLENNSVGTTMTNLNTQIVANMEIPILPANLKQQFVAITNQADKSVFELRKSIDAIDKVIKSLINENL